jgi:hypothetical protein
LIITRKQFGVRLVQMLEVVNILLFYDYFSFILVNT